MKIKNRLVYIAVLLSLVLCNACEELKVNVEDDIPEDAIKIGVMMPILHERGLSESRFFAAVMAAEEINAAGGVIGREIALVRKDDEGNKDVGVSMAEEFKAEDIHLMVGPGWSSVTLKIAPEVLIPNDMLMVSFSATNPAITNLEDKGLVNRTCPSDAFQAKVGADYMFNTLGKKRVGIIHNDNAYNSGLAAAFEAAFSELSGSVVSKVSYPDGQDWSSYDFTSTLDVLFEKKPEAIYMVSFTSDGIKLSNDIGFGGYLSDTYKPTFLSIDGIKSSDLVTNGHPSVTAGMYGTVPSAPEGYANLEHFNNNYVSRFGFDPESFCEHMYDAVYSIAYSIEKARSTDATEVASVLQGITGPDGIEVNINSFATGKEILAAGGDIDYQGASGKIDLDENGDPGSGTYAIWRIENSKYNTVEIKTLP